MNQTLRNCSLYSRGELAKALLESTFEKLETLGFTVRLKSNVVTVAKLTISETPKRVGNNRWSNSTHNIEKILTA